ncbi:hypothetical protein AK812_SmicGene29253 [Symbiodinium microadriaticum]|uniref:Uncharacterized protein n=1 Tax=Symbiodinium microadriaticum TaxID=2951 RepID=A0A1Q9D2B4_SYMMI|nr:hypothetical protein AK812_SmicGene29253 [Symbiodinium microadriaticum]
MYDPYGYRHALSFKKAILIGRLFEFLTGENVRLKHVDVRLRQLQDWVRENIISIGTVKTVLNVADLNTKKLTYARRAFLMYFLSQVEYSEGEDIVHTGVDEYERYEQEKKRENEGCGKKCTWCKVRKCTRKKPAHVYCSCTECIQKYTEDLWRDQYDKVPEASSSTQGPTGKKGSGKLEYMPPSVNQKGNRPAGQGSKGGRRGRAAMEPVTEEQNESMLPESFTQETPVEEQPPTYEDSYEAVDPGTPDSTAERTMGPRDLYL